MALCCQVRLSNAANGESRAAGWHRRRRRVHETPRLGRQGPARVPLARLARERGRGIERPRGDPLQSASSASWLTNTGLTTGRRIVLKVATNSEKRRHESL